MLIIASVSNDRLACWKDALNGMDTVVGVPDLALLKDSMASHAPQMVLLDLEIPGMNGPATIRKLRQMSPTSKIVVLGQPASDSAEISLFAAGIRGCCPNHVDGATLKKVVAAVRRGEPWLRRVLVPRLLDELYCRTPSYVETPVPESVPVAEFPEAKEEISAVAGESERPVFRQVPRADSLPRFPLTGILRKFHIGDRLKLAFLTSDRP